MSAKYCEPVPALRNTENIRAHRAAIQPAIFNITYVRPFSYNSWILTATFALD